MARARPQKSTTKAGMSFRISDILILSVLRHHEDGRVEGRRDRGLLGLPDGGTDRVLVENVQSEYVATSWRNGISDQRSSIPKTGVRVSPGSSLSGTWRDLPAPPRRLSRDLVGTGRPGADYSKVPITAKSSSGDRHRVFNGRSGTGRGAYPFLREAPQIYSAHPTFRTKPECPLV